MLPEKRINSGKIKNVYNNDWIIILTSQLCNITRIFSTMLKGDVTCHSRLTRFLFIFFIFFLDARKYIYTFAKMILTYSSNSSHFRGFEFKSIARNMI